MGIVNKQCWVSFRWTAKGLSHTYICILFPRTSLPSRLGLFKAALKKKKLHQTQPQEEILGLYLYELSTLFWKRAKGFSWIGCFPTQFCPGHFSQLCTLPKSPKTHMNTFIHYLNHLKQQKQMKTHSPTLKLRQMSGPQIYWVSESQGLETVALVQSKLQ